MLLLTATNYSGHCLRRELTKLRRVPARPILNLGDPGPLGVPACALFDELLLDTVPRADRSLLATENGLRGLCR